MHKLATNLNNRNSTVLIFCEMSKAFYFVERNVMFNKMENYGFRGKSVEWMKTYLKNRKQCVEIVNVGTEPI